MRDRCLCLVSLLGWLPSACGEPPAVDPAPIESATLIEGESSGTGDVCPEDGCNVCEVIHEACDDADDPLLAMGLGCPDRDVMESEVNSHEDAIGILGGLGNGSIYAPREGDSMVVLGTGSIDGLTGSAACNDDFGIQFDVGASLPDPIQIDAVGGDCQDDPTLLGTGDCSGTIASPFGSSMSAHDYGEIRFTATAPEGATAVKFDFAFLSSEYPERDPSTHGDMFVAWLESEVWTGNVAFDDAGNPVSLAADFVDARDDGSTLEQFAGTCIAGHAGTGWLTSTAAVAEGETFTMVLAIFDMGDELNDSFVLLDEFRWGCGVIDGPATVAAP